MRIEHFIGSTKKKGSRQRDEQRSLSIAKEKMSMDQSVRFLNLNWNEKRFHQSKSSRDAAKRSIYRAMTGERRTNQMNSK